MLTSALAALVVTLAAARPEAGAVAGQGICEGEDEPTQLLQTSLQRSPSVWQWGFLPSSAEAFIGLEGGSSYAWRSRKRRRHRAIQGVACGHILPAQCGGDIYGDSSRFYGNNYQCHSHGQDFFKPLPVVMRAHPGMDGSCYFNASASYITYIPHPDYIASCASAILGLRAQYKWTGTNTGPLAHFHWEGKPVSSYIDVPHYAYDDLYGFALGYLQGQGLNTSLMGNRFAWEELSAQKCREIQQTYQFKDEELILSDILSQNIPIFVKSFCASGLELPGWMTMPKLLQRSAYNSASDCKTVTLREFAQHHYMKCLLDRKTAAMDMSYLHGRACLLADNRIGHYSECPWSPPGL